MATITLLASSPRLVRYYFYSADGSIAGYGIGVATDTPGAHTLLGDMPAGPLRSQFIKLAAGSWSNGETTFPAYNPMASPRITTIVTPLTTAGAASATSAAVRYVDDSGTNKLQVLGGRESAASPAALDLTNCIVEIRFNHSLA